MVDAKASASPGPNLGVIPDNYSLTYGSGPQIIHVDTAVTRTGKPSIRLDQHTASDVNTCRECDGTWYNVKPGDHIVAKCWIKTEKSSMGDTSVYHGGLIVMSYYGHTSAGYGILCKTNKADSMAGVPGWYGNQPGAIGSYIVPWNTFSWKQAGWDVIIPSDFYPFVYKGGTVVACKPAQIDSFVVVLGARNVMDAGHVWFCDGEIYINPNFTSTPPAPAPTSPPPQNVQNAVSSITPNLAGKRSDWETAPNGFSYYITWESDTVMRLDSRPDGGPYYPYCRENFLIQRYSVSPGTHIYAKVHIKAAPWSGTWSGDAGGRNGGGRVIVDYWIKGKIMDDTNPNFIPEAAGVAAPANGHYINFGTEQDVIINATIPHLNQTDQIDQVILDVQVRPENTGASSVWFSSMEFYIS